MTDMEIVYAMRVEYHDGSAEYLNVQPVPFSDEALRRVRGSVNKPLTGRVVARYEVELRVDVSRSVRTRRFDGSVVQQCGSSGREES